MPVGSSVAGVYLCWHWEQDHASASGAGGAAQNSATSIAVQPDGSLSLLENVDSGGNMPWVSTAAAFASASRSSLGLKNWRQTMTFADSEGDFLLVQNQ